MPWFMYPAVTCRVLNKIATRQSTRQLADERQTLDAVTEKLWHKIERFYQQQGGRKCPV